MVIEGNYEECFIYLYMNIVLLYRVSEKPGK